MTEYGSDFHFISDCNTNNYGSRFLNNKEIIFFANGRHAIISIIDEGIALKCWKRIWIPEYFCYTIVDCIKETGIVLEFYPDSPLENDILLINQIGFKEGDVLLRMNYFGLRSWRCNSHLPIPVIEDHSHDLISDWAVNSNADYCIASVRKTIPIPDGGIAWSPKNHHIPMYSSSIHNDLISYKKFSAMLLKKSYLEHLDISKDKFRKLFIESENQLDNLKELSGISALSLSLLFEFDIELFYSRKKNNWKYLNNELSHLYEIFKPENIENCNPFSLVLKFNKKSTRDNLKSKLINLNVYPAILWQIPQKHSQNIMKIGDTTLSIHCDGRYSINQIEHMTHLIKKII